MKKRTICMLVPIFLIALLLECLGGGLPPGGSAEAKNIPNPNNAYSEWMSTYQYRAGSQREKTMSKAQWNKLRKRFEKRKKNILNSKTHIKKGKKLVPGKTYNGTAYYISNKGSDSNDGLTPKTPFATLHPFREIKLKRGDALFFERGSSWRGEPLCEEDWQFKEIQGLTFSAYGKGAKPRFYGGVENGSGAGKWKLYYKKGKKKIWVYHRKMADVGGIYVNGGKAFARDVAWWSGSAYYKLTGICRYSASGKKYNVKKDLKNGQCFPMLKYSKKTYRKNNRPYVLNWYEQKKGSFDKFVTGSLYFRYDKGNPGKIYKSIEFVQPMESPIWYGGTVSDTTFDNLSFMGMKVMNTGEEGKKNNKIIRSSGVVIQYCESGYMGGEINAYSLKKKNEFNFGVIERFGDGICTDGSNCKTINNYVHDAFQSGMQIETKDGDVDVKNTTISGNVIERCVTAMHVNDNNNNRFSYYINCTFTNNMVFDSGKNNRYPSEKEVWSSKGLNHSDNLFDFGFLGRNPVKKFKIKNNVFGPTVKNAPLISLGHYYRSSRRVFSGNTYIQKKGYDWFMTEDFYRPAIMKVPMTRAMATWLLGDTKAKMWRI